MAVTDYSGLTITQPQTGIQFTKVTDSSADWASIANSTYFYDKADKLVHYKDGTGTVLEIYGASGLGGSGTTNYVSKFTSSSALGNSLIQDNGSNIAVNGTIVSAFKFAVYSTTPGENYNIYGNTTVNGAVGIAGVNQGVGASTNYGASATAQNSTTKNIGIYAAADGVSAENIGGQFKGISATNNYSVQLQDGTEGIGKVLTSMTADGKAQWVTPSSGSSTWNVTTQTGATYTAVSNGYVLVNAATQTVTLPAAANGIRVGVKMINATVTNIRVLTSSAGVTIDGIDRSVTGMPIFNQYDAYTFVSDGTNWWIMG